MKAPTAADRRYWDKVCEGGCIVTGCEQAPQIHHAKTGAGGRKDHRAVLPLCYYHHQGGQGIHTLSRRIWQRHYGFEQDLLERVRERMGMP